MKSKTENTKEQKASRLARLTPMLYSSVGLGLCTVVSFAAMAQKWPRGLGD